MTLKELWGKFLCATNNHNWTSAVLEDIPATGAQLAGGRQGFEDYAKMYCKRCNVISPLSRRGLGTR